MVAFHVRCLAVLALAAHMSSSFIPGASPPRATGATRRTSALRMTASMPKASFPKLDEVDGGEEIVEPKGSYEPWWSPMSVVQAGKWAAAPGEYFAEKQAEADGEPVFKMHPGVASIALVDSVSGEWFFNQPDSVLDRQGGAYFGTFSMREEFLGKTLPALITNIEEGHPAIRDLLLSVTRERLPKLEGAFAHADASFYGPEGVFGEQGLGDYRGVYSTTLRQTTHFIMELLLGLGEEGGKPLPPFDVVEYFNIGAHHLKLDPDQPVSKAIGNMLTALALKLDMPKIDTFLEAVRSSDVYPRYQEMLAATEAPVQDLDRAIAFTASFQSCVALSTQMEFVINMLGMDKGLLQELRDELDGKELTLSNIDSADAFPVLDSFFWEVLRCFPAPPFFFKVARKDLLVPAGNGKSYKVREGELVCTHLPLVHLDPSGPFGADAREFVPGRFLGKPELKKKVVAYGYPDYSSPDMGPGKPWGCVAHAAGFLTSTIKLFYARWIQEAEWTLTQTPEVDPVKFLGVVGPGTRKNEFATLSRRAGRPSGSE